MSEKTFHLGLCMAGAISAGAYTAGVVDYLLETLEKWEVEKEKARQNPGAHKDIPMHDVVISVMTGASAGGMTAIITSAAIQNKIDPITIDRRNDEDYKKKNKFYHAWVNMEGDNMLMQLLSTSDIEKDKKARSLLNSEFIENIANEVIQIDKENMVDRKYIHPNLELLVTLSNISGIPYKIGFLSDAPGGYLFYTKAHNDFGHFMLMKDDDELLATKGQIPLSYLLDKNVEVAKQCAMATGAFPIGLAQRKIKRNKKYIVENPFINRLYKAPNNDIAIPDPYLTLNLDGGMINNEPFEYTRQLLKRRTDEDAISNSNFNSFKSCTLMVDPFPSSDSENFDIENSLSLVSAVKNILSTVTSQLLFRPDDIEQALNEKNASRFLIAPKRTVGNVGTIGSKAIASGSLGGFGGFIDKSFREHDFYLGRRNCQYFLRKIFTIPSDCTNPIFTEGYANPEAKERFQSALGPLPIIPDMLCNYSNLSINAEPEKEWPSISENHIDQYENPLKNRIEKVTFSLLDDMPAIDKFLLRVGFRILIHRKVKNVVLNWMKRSLKKHQLMD